MRTDDSSIIYTCLNGEPEAFGVLVDKYKAGIFAYVYARANNFQDVQEITQDVFLCAYRGLHSLKRYESFSFWLFRIAANLCKKWLRNQIRHPQPESIDDIDPKAIDNSSIKSHHEEMMDQSVREALNTLPETYREVLMLYYFGDMDSKEIAESLGTSPTAIRMRISRAREQFKEEMIAMMGTAFEQQKLHASFTFRIVEAIKRIKIHPISQAKGLPLGLSLATGLMIAVLSFNPYMTQVTQFGNTAGLPLPVESKVLKVGEIPVDVVKTSEKTIISNKLGKAGNGEPQKPDIQNAFMSPQAEGGTWTKKNDMPTAKHGLATCTIDDKIYVIGGCTVNAGIYTSIATVEEYDPKNDSWTKKADMPTPRDLFGVGVIDGKIYAIGGETLAGGGGWLTSAVEEYDPKIDEWTKKQIFQLQDVVHLLS